jgi:BMFP domain-containing protein YqiC
MTVLTLQAPARARRIFWEPSLAVVVAAILYLRVAAGQWGGLVALGAELVLAIVIRARVMHRVDEEIELLERLLSRDWTAIDADRLISGAAERIQLMFVTASSAILAAGMAASAFLLLFYANVSSAGAGIVSVAPKAFVATGYAILCALALTRDAHHVTATVGGAKRRPRLDDGRPAVIATAQGSAEAPVPQYEHLIAQLVAMQISHLEALNDTNRLLSAAASDRVDEESGTVRVKLAKGLTEFRKSVEQLNAIVQSLNARLDNLTSEESALFEHHRRELVSEVSRLPQQVIDRAAGLVASSVAQVEDRFRHTLQTIHDEETRRARDLLAGEFMALRSQFEATEHSVSAIAARFNEVVSSLDALASAFDRSAKSVVASASDFTREAESLTFSVTDALARLGNADATKASLLTPLTDAATAVRKASSLVATDLRRVAAERERLGRVRLKILELLPKEQGS